MRFHLSLVLPALLAPALLAQRTAEIEPNNSPGIAQAFTLGSQVDATLVAGDQDWYSFTVASYTRVRIHTSTAPSAPIGDTRIALLDATGTVYLAVDDDARGSGNGYTSDLTLNLAAGSYKVQVVGFSATTNGPYSIEIAEITPVAYTGSEVEPNDTPQTATPTTLSPIGSRYLGNVGASTPQAADLVPASVTMLSDLVALSTTTVITATSPLVASAYVPGYAVVMTSGANVGLLRVITANTTTTITTAAWPVASAAGDTFDVIAYSNTTLIRATGALTAGAWTPAVAGFGRFYVRFTSGANNGQYRQITANTASTISTGSFLFAPAAGDTYVVELCDVDYWQVVLTAPTEGLWFQVNEGDAPSVFGHRVEIYDAAGVPLAPASSTTVPAFGANNITASTLAARTSQVRVWPAGTYYLVVRGPASPLIPNGSMPNGLVPTGNYMLELFGMPMDVGGTVVEAAEPNNTIATATPIAPGQTGQGSISISGGGDSSDWWGPIVISQPSAITYQTRGGAAPALGDSTINLRDANGNILLNSVSGNLLAVTTSTTGLHARATVTFPLTPSTYYIEVLSPGTAAAQGGNYELQISTPVAAPYVTASYTLTGAQSTCGSAPFPMLTNQWTSGTTVSSGEIPLMGSTFSRNLVSCPASAIYVLALGFSDTLYQGSLPLPLDLTPIGAPGCTLNVDPVILNVGFADASGTANLVIQLPGTTALRGFVWFEQALVANAAANAFGAQFSNVGRIITGERSY